MWPAPEDDRDNTPLKQMPDGDCLFWGVPFSLGAREDKRLLLVTDAGLKSVPSSAEVAVGRKASRLLFAHVCAPISGEWATIEGTGEGLATYRIVYADGSAEEQTLRRRFEIHDVNIPWGHHPFLCRNCRNFRGMPLNDLTIGYGQTQVGAFNSYQRPGSDEVGPGGIGSDMQGWWLFDWVNPSPEKTIDKIEITAAGATAVALGGITLCQEDADPFAWPPREDVAITVGDGGDEAPEVTMDRGVVARQDVLFEPADDFLTTDETGWGSGGQTTRQGGYLEVHGSPESRLDVKGGDVEASFRWGDVLADHSVEQGKIRVEMVSPKGKQWVHVRVEDEDTGDTVGTRVHFRSPQGAYLAPHGHQADVNIAWFEDMGGDCKTRGVPYAYIDGTCQIELPIGDVFVEAVRGFEYTPTRQQMAIKPGQRHLTVKVKRAFDMKKRGYYSGDTHVHFLSSQSAHLEAAAEDLNVVNLLASQWGRLFTSWEEFTGGLAPTSSDEHKIWVSQENRQHVLGHISLLGLKELVAPMCTGGPNEDWVGGEVQTLMADWAEACKAQGGLVIMPHMPLPDFENAANIVLGHADAAEMCWVWQGEQIGTGEKGYYRWLNIGQKLPIVGGTDKMSNGRILGGSRTYARLADGEEFTYENWCQAVKRGNTFASTGAVIDLKVDGRDMGQQLDLPGNGGTVEVEVTAESVWPLSGVELIVNGVPNERVEASNGGERTLTLSHKLKTEKSCWVTARCWGNYRTDAGPVMAHSSPVYVDVGRRCAFEESDGQYLLTHMEGGITWAERIGVFRDEAVRKRLIGLFREAGEELKRRWA